MSPPLAGAGPFDVIASNPPYVRRAEMKTLAPEVREWEPKWALESGDDGMDGFFYAAVEKAA